jgi:cytochrome c-type biogenesis protein
VNTGEFSLFTPLLALGFGLLSFLSPCCLPLLPAYLGMIAGSAGAARGDRGRWTLLWNGLAFVAGLSIVFALLGASASALGLLLLEQRLLLIQLGGLLIVLFGLQMLGILRLGWLARTYLHLDPERFAARGGLAGAFLVGAAFSIGWTPCIGLFLGSLLTLAAQEQTVGAGTVLLLFYGLGLGIPFVVAGLAADRALHWSRGLRMHLGLIERLNQGQGGIYMEGRLKDGMDSSAVAVGFGLENGLAAAFDFIRPSSQAAEERAHMLANAGPGAEAGIGGHFGTDPAPDVLTGPNLLHLLWCVSDSKIDVTEPRAGGRQRTRCLDS